MSKKLTLNDFICRSREIHGDKYDYSKVEYVNNSTKVCLICPIHGEFWQTPGNHLQGKGCQKCVGKCFTNEEKIKKAFEVHNGKYDYSKSDFSSVRVKTTIICPIHGDFLMDYNHHVNNRNGCPYCSGKIKLTNAEFETRAKKVHNGKYKYFNDYVNMHEKVKIECLVHGAFYQQAQAHLRGQGCPKCVSCSKLEENIKFLLTENNIFFEEQKKFPWLGGKSLDFYLPQHNIAIECQGKQHFGEGGWSKNKAKRDEFLLSQKERDIEKYTSCEEHGIKILYYSNFNFKDEYFSKVFLSREELIKEIINTK